MKRYLIVIATLAASLLVAAPAEATACDPHGSQPAYIACLEAENAALLDENNHLRAVETALLWDVYHARNRIDSLERESAWQKKRINVLEYEVRAQRSTIRHLRAVIEGLRG